MNIGLRSFKACLAFAALAVAASGASANEARPPAPAKYEEVRTQFVEAGGTRYAYRRYGKESAVPLVLFAHFRASMDNWDPQLLNNLAEHRTVIAFNNKGVSSSSGETPDTIAAMADDAAEFIAALGYAQVDTLGFSIGGAVAQELALRHPALVRRAILAGTAPQGAEGVRERDPKVGEVARNTPVELTDFLYLFFEPTPASQAAGRAFLQRRGPRSVDPDPASSEQTMLAQGKASAAYFGSPPNDPDPLKSLAIPVLVANGSNDIMLPTINSYRLFERLPNARLILFPDSGHGFLFQYPDVFAEQVTTFLDDDPGSARTSARP